MQPRLLLTALTLLLNACGGGGGDDGNASSTGGSSQTPPTAVVLDYTLQPAIKEVPYARGLERGPGGIYLLGDLLWRSTDEGQSWSVAYNAKVGDVAETSDARLWAERYVQGLGYRVMEVLGRSSVTLLDAPWEGSLFQVSGLALTASADTLWVQVSGLADAQSVAPAQLWRYRGGSWTQLATPMDSGLWVMAASASGGLLIYDGYSTNGPYNAYRADAADQWQHLGGWVQVGDIIETAQGNVLLQVRSDPVGSWQELRVAPAGTSASLLSGPRKRHLRSDGSLVRVALADGSMVEQSSDDGVSWQATAATPTAQFVIDYVPTATGLLGVQYQFVSRFEFSDPRWVIDGWPSGDGYDVADVAAVGSRLVAGLANTVNGTRVTRLVVSSDNGASWEIGPVTTTLPTTICGSELVWLVVGPADSRGNSYAFLSPDARTVREETRISIPNLINPPADRVDYAAAQYYKQYGLNDLAFNRFDAIDCAINSDRAVLSIADLVQDDGLLLRMEGAIDLTFTNTGDDWRTLLMPLDLGDHWPAPAALILGDTYLPAATFSAATPIGAGHNPFYVYHDTLHNQLTYWATPIDIKPGPITPITQAVAGGMGLWVYADGTLTQGENALVRTTPNGYPTGAELLGATGAADGHLWMATSQGLYRTILVPSVNLVPSAN